MLAGITLVVAPLVAVVAIIDTDGEFDDEIDTCFGLAVAWLEPTDAGLAVAAIR